MKKRMSWFESPRVVLALFLAAQSFLAPAAVMARLTGTNPGTDIWCMGPSGAELCVDASGNFIPTTDNDATLGTASLRFSSVQALDIAIGDDLTVTDDATITDALDVGGATDLDGQVTIGAAATKSTITVVGAASFPQTVTAGAGVVGSTLTITGASTLQAATLSSTLDVAGQTTLGANTTKSTFTSTGNASIHGTLTVGSNVTLTAGFLQFYSRSEAQIRALTPTVVGQAYFCNDCTTTAICISTGTVVQSFAAVEDPSAICD